MKAMKEKVCLLAKPFLYPIETRIFTIFVVSIGTSEKIAHEIQPNTKNSKDHIVDNKSSAQAKKNTDKYILRRDEGGYWDDAGDDIDRYKVELWSNFHPKGYQVPCCRAPRQGFDDYSKGWKVDVLVDEGGKLVIGKWVSLCLQQNNRSK